MLPGAVFVQDYVCHTKSLYLLYVSSASWAQNSPESVKLTQSCQVPHFPAISAFTDEGEKSQTTPE